MASKAGVRDPGAGRPPGMAAVLVVESQATDDGGGSQGKYDTPLWLPL